jgi:hypothetical protein
MVIKTEPAEESEEIAASPPTVSPQAQAAALVEAAMDTDIIGASLENLSVAETQADVPEASLITGSVTIPH